MEDLHYVKVNSNTSKHSPKCTQNKSVIPVIIPSLSKSPIFVRLQPILVDLKQQQKQLEGRKTNTEIRKPRCKRCY